MPANSPDIEILYMTVSADNTKIGVALGTHVIKEQFKLCEIAIYKKSDSLGEFELEKLRDIEFDDAC